jgi:hypothetical protein
VREPAAVRLHRALLGLLPSSVTAEDRREIGDTYAALWRDAATVGRKARLVVVGPGRLPWVIVREWWDHLERRPAGRRTREGDGMRGAWSAVRYGSRSLAKSPAFTWSVVLLLGLGIGAVTTIFSVVDHVVLRQLPYPSADRLVEVENGSHSAPTFRRLSGMRTLDAVAGIHTTDAILTGGDEPLRLTEAQVTREFFPMFGARPAVGRLLVADDFERGDRVAWPWAPWGRGCPADCWKGWWPRSRPGTRPPSGSPSRCS